MTGVTASSTAAVPAESSIKRTAKLIDSSIFVAFKTLTSDSDAERIDGGLSLLHQLDRTHDAEKVTYKLSSPYHPTHELFCSNTNFSTNEPSAARQRT